LVVLDGGLQVQAKPKGKLTRMKIKILPGDRVQVQLNEVDPTKGYIIYRL
jgi:translation initiation factor IF-1